MKWTKPDPALVERFTSALPDDPRVASRKMFGYPACFVRGSYFAGLHGEAFVIRLPGGLKERFPALASAAVFDPMGTGKGMKDWWVIPPRISKDRRRLAALLAETLAEVAKLPAKKKAPTRSRAG